VQAARCWGVAFHAKPVVGTMAIELRIAIPREALRSLVMEFSPFFGSVPCRNAIRSRSRGKSAEGRGPRCDGRHAYVDCALYRLDSLTAPSARGVATSKGPGPSQLRLLGGIHSENRRYRNPISSSESPSPRRLLHRGRKRPILGRRGGAALLKVFDNAGVPVCGRRCHAPLVYFKGE
jgi:hypothetical protein